MKGLDVHKSEKLDKFLGKNVIIKVNWNRYVHGILEYRESDGYYFCKPAHIQKIGGGWDQEFPSGFFFRKTHVKGIMERKVRNADGGDAE